MTTVRRIVTEFGIEVDTTGIKRYNSAINTAKKRTSGLDKVKLNGLRRQLKGIVGLVSGLTLAGAIGGTVKAFQRFGMEEKALEQVRFQLSKTPGEFEKTTAGITNTIGETQGLISKLDLLNASAAAFEIDTNPEAFRNTLLTAAKLSTVLKDFDVVQVSEAFAQFRATGATGALKAFGFFTAKELEVLENAGNEVTEVGISQRTKLQNRLIAKNEKFIETGFQSFLKTSAASSQQLSVSADEFSSALGESAGVIKTVNKNLSAELNALTESIEKQRGVFDTIGALREAELRTNKERLESERKERKERGITTTQQALEQIFGITPGGGSTAPKSDEFKSLGGEAGSSISRSFDSLLSTFRTTFSGGSNKSQVTNNITVNTQATDAEGIAKEIGPAIQKQMGPIHEQAIRSTKIHGKNQTTTQ